MRSLQEPTLGKLTGQFIHLILDRLFHRWMAVTNTNHGCTTYSPKIRITVEIADGTISISYQLRRLASFHPGGRCISPPLCWLLEVSRTRGIRLRRTVYWCRSSVGERSLALRNEDRWIDKSVTAERIGYHSKIISRVNIER